MSSRILLVEDDEALARIVGDNLTFDGFEVEWATNSEAAIDAARHRTPDLILLDIMLPGKSGFEIFGLLQQGRRVPVIILTALSRKVDKLRGLRLGADDYVTKPFDLEELLARVHVVLRRTQHSGDRVRLGQVTVDFRARSATCGQEVIHLTNQELELLKYLAARAGSVVHRDELLREVWKYPEAPATRSVDHAIARLRKKIEPNPARPTFIHTIHGDGYYLTPSES